ncbi:MAG: histidine phosphatase family protein [Devosia sp.]
MSYGLYVTHPQVVQDPNVPVPKWGLTALGKQRAERFANHELLKGVTRIVSSTETKALELAAILAGVCKVPVESGDKFGENDRTSTGFVLPERFEALADAFFAHPYDSVEGWETSRDAQRRIVGAFEAALVGHDVTQPIVFTGHGAVGTLLKCHLGNRTIARSEDQRVKANPGGGNVFVFRLSDRALLTEWMAMENLPARIPGLGSPPP